MNEVSEKDLEFINEIKRVVKEMNEDVSYEESIPLDIGKDLFDIL